MRLAIFCRRFWPYCDAEETEVADLAQALIDAGHSVQVLTIQWCKEWPLQFQYREIPVYRFYRRWSGPWGMFRFAKELERHVQTLDLEGLIVFGLSQESWVVLKSMCRLMPVVSRVNLRQVHVYSKNVFSRPLRRIPHQLREMFVDSVLAEDILQKIHGRARLPTIEIVPSMTLARQAPALSIQLRTTLINQLRSQLTEAHPVLAIDGRGPLVVINSYFDEPTLGDLILNWRCVLDHFPESRLWMLGDGPKAKKVWEEICDAGLAESIIMPGYFDHLDDVILAADLCVGFIHDEKQAPSAFALKAMAYQIPLILHAPAFSRQPLNADSTQPTGVHQLTETSPASLDPLGVAANKTSLTPLINRSFGTGKELAETIRNCLENVGARTTVLPINSTSASPLKKTVEMTKATDLPAMEPVDIYQQLSRFINALQRP